VPTDRYQRNVTCESGPMFPNPQDSFIRLEFCGLLHEGWRKHMCAVMIKPSRACFEIYIRKSRFTVTPSYLSTPHHELPESREAAPSSLRRVTPGCRLSCSERGENVFPRWETPSLREPEEERRAPRGGETGVCGKSGASGVAAVVVEANKRERCAAAALKRIACCTAAADTPGHLSPDCAEGPIMSSP